MSSFGITKCVLRLPPLSFLTVEYYVDVYGILSELLIKMSKVQIANINDFTIPLIFIGLEFHVFVRNISD